MRAAKIGKIYTYNGKRYVACEAEDITSCKGCDLYAPPIDWYSACPRMIRNGKPYSCINKVERNHVIFKMVKNEK